ncbi:hypothetical protein ACG5V6_12475 [Streptomyces chitinivorans]|uniref:Uncharacterized protein n=1 Tax=Streptomyces chitinivorans TaxID=1257027 RepID=A0ABW7HTF4_9ACTN|nr:hypothetical protein [Streptomyces chitinivorans]MDH2409622.1 hypothetical protein [Streptomyces chitinivorans]
MTEAYDGYLPVFGAPPAKYLPRPVKELLKARDEAHAEWVEAEDKWLHLLSSDWRDQAIARDKAAARAAVAEGKDPFELPSELEAAERDRPRAMAVVEDLARKVRVADRALKDAVRRNMPEIERNIGQALAKARDAYVDAQRKADDARQAFGAALADRSTASDWAVGAYTDFPGVAEASPRDARGQAPVDAFQRPLWPGMPEVRAIEASYEAIGVADLYGETGEPRKVADPLVSVRARNSGLVFEVKASHARSLVASGQAEYTDEIPNV